MTTSAKLTTKGQITIPADVRQALGVKEGDRLVFEQTGNREFSVRPAAKGSPLKGILKPFLKTGQSISLDQMEAAIASRAEDRLRRK